MKCNYCKEELPESAFYPSFVRKHWHICRNCIKARKALEGQDAVDFERFYGGIRINIVNYPQEFEISQTSGEYFRTKNKEEFIEHLLKIIKSQS